MQGGNGVIPSRPPPIIRGVEMETEVNEAARKYTYEDYLNRDDDVRFELIDGVIHMMATPLRVHQGILGELHVQFYNYLKGKPCKVYMAPFSVRLSVGEGSDTVLEPDLVVICDKEKMDDRGCVGAPDMVVEILSPSTSRKDRITKFNKYLQAGVREYWIVDPSDKSVSVYVLRDGEYVSRAYADKDIAPVSILEGCGIVLQDVFEDVNT